MDSPAWRPEMRDWCLLLALGLRSFSLYDNTYGLPEKGAREGGVDRRQ